MEVIAESDSDSDSDSDADSDLHFASGTSSDLDSDSEMEWEPNTDPGSFNIEEVSPGNPSHAKIKRADPYDAPAQWKYLEWLFYEMTPEQRRRWVRTRSAAVYASDFANFAEYQAYELLHYSGRDKFFSREFRQTWDTLFPSHQLFPWETFVKDLMFFSSAPIRTWGAWSTRYALPYPSATLLTLFIWRVEHRHTNMARQSAMERAAEETLAQLRQIERRIKQKTQNSDDLVLFCEWWMFMVESHPDEFRWVLGTLHILASVIWDKMLVSIDSISYNARLFSRPANPMDRYMEMDPTEESHNQEVDDLELACWVAMTSDRSAASFLRVVCGFVELYRYTRQSTIINSFARGLFDYDEYTKNPAVYQAYGMKDSTEATVRENIAVQWQTTVAILSYLHQSVLPVVLPKVLLQPLLIFRGGGKVNGDYAPDIVTDTASSSTSASFDISAGYAYTPDASGVVHMWVFVVPTRPEALPFSPPMAFLSKWSEYSIEDEILVLPTFTWKRAASYNLDQMTLPAMDPSLDDDSDEYTPDTEAGRALAERSYELNALLQFQKSTPNSWGSRGQRVIDVYVAQQIPMDVLYKNI